MPTFYLFTRGLVPAALLSACLTVPGLSLAQTQTQALAQTVAQTVAQIAAPSQIQQQQQQYRQALPDENVLARLVWSTMIALDNANRTDNYSVLNSLGSPQFQTNNPPDRLSDIFFELRQNRVDIGRAVLSTPSYYLPPAILEDGTLRLRGGFDYRPNSIRFDLIYANIGGGWQINAISVVEMDAGAPK